jgi:NADPH:quinone reductase-like Zn-dependent oxidoreductase
MSNQKMKAIQLHDYAEPDGLKVEELPVPQPEAGQVLIRMFASGVNPADWKYGRGLYKKFRPLTFPWIPGLEGAGVVEAVGTGVTQFKPGQSVYGPFQGSYAEFAVAAASDLLLKPEDLSFDEAATIPVASLTAWGTLFDTAQVKPGMRVLVHGAAGGVGHWIVQLAHWKGAYVIGTASTGNKEFVRSLGAQEVIDYTTVPFEEVVQNVDVAIDTVGGDVAERSVKSLRQGGTLITIAGMLPAEIGKEKGIQAARGGRASIEAFREIQKLIETGQVKPKLFRSFPLIEAGKAWELSITGHGQGRIILKIAS